MGRMKYDIEQLNALPIIEVATTLGIPTGRSNKTLCFMHTEKTASLSFDKRTNRWHCFGCGKGGGVIDLAKEYKKLDFVGACNWLEKNILGRCTNEYTHNKKTFQNPCEQSEFSDESVVDSRIYKDILDTLSLAMTDKDYLCKKRALSHEVVQNSGIRSIENIIAFYKCIKDKYETDRLLSAGLLRISDSGEIKNTWQNSGIVFPYRSVDGEIVNLQLRPHTHFPTRMKYILLSGVKTSLFNAHALKAYNTGDIVFLCEGAIDTLSLLSKGKKAVGLPGVGAFKDEWLRLLGRFNVVLLFDNDNAGLSQSIKLSKKLQENGITVRCQHVPAEFKDVNDMLVAELRSWVKV